MSPKVNIGEYEIIDNQDGTIDINHPSTGESITINGNSIDSVTINTDDITITNDGDGSGIDADLVDGYNIQKNGSDASGIINFKT